MAAEFSAHILKWDLVDQAKVFHGDDCYCSRITIQNIHLDSQIGWWTTSQKINYNGLASVLILTP